MKTKIFLIILAITLTITNFILFKDFYNIKINNGIENINNEIEI